MPVEVVSDDSGDTMTLIRYNDNRFVASDFVEETILNMRNVELRHDDVMLCSYSKSGCHWVWEILRMLRHGSTNLEVVDKEHYMIEYNTLDQLSALPSPRILNNHMFWDSQPRDLVEKKIKTVFFYRNPKDVAVSFFNHHRKFKDYDYNGKFSNYLKRLVQGKVDNCSPFQYLKSWEEAIASHPEQPIFVGNYEDMKENPLAELRRLSTFLGHDHSDNFLQQVAEMTSFDSMKKRKFPVAVLDDEGQPIMYRKGEVGDWRNYFTPEQSAWFDQIIRDQMAGSRFRFRYQLDSQNTMTSLRKNSPAILRQGG
ncbi:sulfotransferase 1A1-like [Physella acuta]|uniref:sulfotransferase 1A1-like n=1 Tax=Physella acuta TaxID=109671 RepID=UPI0027DB4EE3|nr:sulfotransferase 1A1-like [Physella acuta]